MIIIIGGGIGGLSTALSLAQKGIASTVLEQAPRIREEGYGLVLGSNFCKIMDALGLLEQFKAISTPPESLQWIEASNGESILKVPIEEFTTVRFHYPCVTIHREDIIALLFKSCLANPLIRLMTSEKVIDFEDLNSEVSVRTEKNLYKGDAVISAEGVWSKFRSKIVEDKPKLSGIFIYRGMIPMEEAPKKLQTNNVSFWMGDQAYMVHYPVRNKKLLNFAAIFRSQRYEQGKDNFGNAEELFQAYKNFHPDIQFLISKIDVQNKWRLGDRDPLKHWSKGRLTLLGDAAHPMYQFISSGAAMAIEDSFVLAQKLEECQGDFEKGFAEYEKERYLRTAKVQLASRIYGDIYLSPEGAVSDLRKALFKDLSATQFYEHLAWLLEGVDIQKPKKEERLAA